MFLGLQNNIFTKISILNIKEKSMYYIMLTIINCLFYCELFLFYVPLLEDNRLFDLSNIKNKPLFDLLMDESMLIIIIIGVIILEYDVFGVLQSRNAKEYKIMYECGASRQSVFIHKFTEYILTDIIGFCVTILVLLAIDYSIKNYDVIMSDVIKLLILIILAKHLIIGRLCFKTSKF